MIVNSAVGQPLGDGTVTAVCQGHVQTDPIGVLAADGALYLCGMNAVLWASRKVRPPRERDSSLAQFSHIVIHRRSHLHVVEMGSLCGNSVGQCGAGGHCMSATRSHQQSHLTHPIMVVQDELLQGIHS